MTSRTGRLYLLVPVLLALSACSAAGGAEATSPGARGAIELALSESCAEGSDSPCVVVNGHNILLPSTFERAGVEAAAVAEGEQQSAVDVTFTDDGAAVLRALTKQAAGTTARLVLKAGDEILAAVMVMEALDGEQLHIIISPDDDAQKIVELIREG